MKPRSQPPLTLGAWFRHDEIARVVQLSGPRSVLEFGVGQGAMGARLATGRTYVGIEPDAESRAIARGNLPQEARLLSSIAELGDERFDLICAFEVLEHIEDDRSALEEWLAHLAPGGTLLVSVPGFASRFGAWDTHVGHLRRYDPDAIEELLRSVGLQSPRVTVTGYPLGFLLEGLRNQVARRRSGSGTAHRPSDHRLGSIDLAADAADGINPAEDAAERTAASGRLLQPSTFLGPLFRYGSAPFRWLQRRRPDIGIGVVASATKPPTTSGS